MENEDKDFAWKVRQRMKEDRNPLFVTLADKYQVKSYAASRGVKSATILYVTENAESIPFHVLPERCFVKANHGCGWNLYCELEVIYLFESGVGLVNTDGSLVEADEAFGYRVSQEDCISICQYWLSQAYSTTEWACQFISPKIIVEEALTSRTPGDLKDYRMYTFDGKVRAINVGSPTYRMNYENAFFDTAWNEIKLTKYKERLPNPMPPKPDTLAEMIDAAERLGGDLDFARIDLYDTTKGVMLGEVTLYPEDGCNDTPTACPVFNKWLGDQWK